MTSRWGVWLVGRYTMFLLLAAVIVRCCDWSKYHNSYILTPIMNIVIAGTVYKTDLARMANRIGPIIENNLMPGTCTKRLTFWGMLRNFD